MRRLAAWVWADDRAVIFISTDPPCSEPLFSLALAKMPPGCVQNPKKDRLVAVVPGQWSAKEGQAGPRGDRFIWRFTDTSPAEKSPL